MANVRAAVAMISNNSLYSGIDNCSFCVGDNEDVVTGRLISFCGSDASEIDILISFDSKFSWDVVSTTIHIPGRSASTIPVLSSAESR
jgi:hypothetical protein